MTSERPTLLDAVLALNDRKQAVVGDLTFLDTLQGRTNDNAPLMLAGTDLDPDEAEEVARSMAESSVVNVALAARVGQLETCLGGLWLDGLITGLMLADLRARHDAQEAASDG